MGTSQGKWSSSLGSGVKKEEMPAGKTWDQHIWSWATTEGPHLIHTPVTVSYTMMETCDGTDLALNYTDNVSCSFLWIHEILLIYSPQNLHGMLRPCSLLPRYESKSLITDKPYHCGATKTQRDSTRPRKSGFQSQSYHILLSNPGQVIHPLWASLSSPVNEGIVHQVIRWVPVCAEILHFPSPSKQ